MNALIATREPPLGVATSSGVSHDHLNAVEISDLNFVDALRSIADMTGHEAPPLGEAEGVISSRLFADCFPEVALRHRLVVTIALLARLLPFPCLSAPVREQYLSQFGARHMTMEEIAEVLERATAAIKIGDLTVEDPLEDVEVDYWALRLELKSALLRLSLEVATLRHRAASTERSTLSDLVDAPSSGSLTSDDVRVAAFQKTL